MMKMKSMTGIAEAVDGPRRIPALGKGWNSVAVSLTSQILFISKPTSSISVRHHHNRHGTIIFIAKSMHNLEFRFAYPV